MKRGHKIVSLLIACAMVTPLAFSNVNTVEAANKFEGQETKYYKLCSSKTLTRSNQNTCKEFNKYLKTKSASLKSEISSKQSSVDSAKLFHQVKENRPLFMKMGALQVTRQQY